jgi:hypothetical protein
MRIAALGSSVLFVACIAAGSAGGAGGFQVERLTHDLVVDSTPQIADLRIAWLRGREVHLLENGTMLQLTEGTGTQTHASLRATATLVAWRTCGLFDGISCWEPWRLFVYDGEEVVPLTAPGSDVTALDADGSSLAWVASGDVYLHDGEETERLTRWLLDGLVPASRVALSGPTVVWEAGGDLHRYHLGKLDVLTDASYPGSRQGFFDLDASDGRVVWSDAVGDDQEIFLFDGEEVLQLTDDDAQQYFPRISGGRVVWQVTGLDGGDDAEIHLFDGEASAPLTDNDFPDTFPQVSATHVVWVAKPGGSDAPAEIFAYDGAEIHRVTENDYEDAIPSISGSRFVWYGCPGSKGCRDPVRPYGLLDGELFLAPEASASLQALVAVACVAGLAALRQVRAGPPRGVR